MSATCCFQLWVVIHPRPFFTCTFFGSTKLITVFVNTCTWTAPHRYTSRTAKLLIRMTTIQDSRCNTTRTSSLYGRLYWTPAASSKQPVKDNEIVVSDWLPMSRMWHEKVSSATLTFKEPIMYPKILKHGLPALAGSLCTKNSYCVFIPRLYANGYQF